MSLPTLQRSAQPGMLNPLRAPGTHARLILRLVSRDLAARYRGSFFGVAWFVLQPLITLAVFTFLFSVVFQSRWAGADAASPKNYTLLMWIGLLVHNLLFEAVVRAPGLVSENPSYVKKVVFPLEILPVVAILVAIANTCVGAALLLVFQLLLVGLPPATALLTPLVVLPVVILSLGLTYIVASLGVFIRDLRQVMPVLAQTLLFLGPVLYPTSILPKVMQPYLYLNPLTLIIEEARAVFFDGRMPAWGALALYALVACLVLVAGVKLFSRLRPAFSDVV